MRPEMRFVKSGFAREQDPALPSLHAQWWPRSVIAVPVTTVMMFMAAQPKAMGKFIIKGWLRWLGSTAAISMVACVMGMIVGWFVRLSLSGPTRQLS